MREPISQQSAARQLDRHECQMLDAFFERVNPQIIEGMSRVLPGENFVICPDDGFIIEGKEYKLSRAEAQIAKSKLESAGWRVHSLEPDSRGIGHLQIYLMRPERTSLFDSTVDPTSPFSEPK